jgi:hypothetical protein
VRDVEHLPSGTAKARQASSGLLPIGPSNHPVELIELGKWAF